MKIRTDELIGAALNWAVAYCEGLPMDCRYWHHYRFADDWDAGGPIIERDQLSVWAEGPPDATVWVAWLRQPEEVQYTTGLARRYCNMRGPTPLIAAMRCRVASKLGDEVEVPDSLGVAPCAG